MASVSSALRRIKDELSSFLPDQAILAACRRAGHHWRQRKLGPVQTIHLFILQVVNFNTAMTALRHLSQTAVRAPGYCKSRMRLPLVVLQALLLESSAAMRQACSSADGLWCGLKAYLVDGSSTIAPDTPDSQKAFGQPAGCKKGCGFPVPKVLGLFDAFSGLVVQVLGFPLFTHEQSKVWMLHPLLGGSRRYIAGAPWGICWWETGASAPSCIWRCCFPEEFTGFSASTRRRSSTSVPIATIGGSIAKDRRSIRPSSCPTASSSNAWASGIRSSSGSSPRPSPSG